MLFSQFVGRQITDPNLRLTPFAKWLVNDACMAQAILDARIFQPCTCLPECHQLHETKSAPKQESHQRDLRSKQSRRFPMYVHRDCQTSVPPCAISALMNLSLQ